MSTNKTKTSTTKYVSGEAELKDWLKDFSVYIRARHNEEKTFSRLPEDFATGFARVVEIEKGLTYRLVDYQLNTDFKFEREPGDSFCLILYFYTYSNCNKLYIKIDGEEIVNGPQEIYRSQMMTNSRTFQELFVSSGTIVQGLTIQLSEDWLKAKIQNPSTANYSIFQNDRIFQTFVSAKSQKLLAEIFEKKSPSNLPGLYRNNRVLRLLEDFLENILTSGTSGNSLPFSTPDAENILKIESFLAENYSGEFPGVEELARMAYMSPTKLKTLFRKAYNCGLYSYYQKNRMHKARELLLSGQYSISKVGEITGYQNLSNFSKAFKKEFGKLPKSYLKESGL